MGAMATPSILFQRPTHPPRVPQTTVRPQGPAYSIHGWEVFSLTWWIFGTTQLPPLGRLTAVQDFSLAVAGVDTAPEVYIPHAV